MLFYNIYKMTWDYDFFDLLTPFKKKSHEGPAPQTPSVRQPDALVNTGSLVTKHPAISHEPP